MCYLYLLNLFVPNVTFLNPLKILENHMLYHLKLLTCVSVEIGEIGLEIVQFLEIAISRKLQGLVKSGGCSKKPDEITHLH